MLDSSSKGDTYDLLLQLPHAFLTSSNESDRQFSLTGIYIFGTLNFYSLCFITLEYLMYPFLCMTGGEQIAKGKL